METLVVECLRCGTARVARRDVFKHFETPECSHCGYLGWAPARDLPEPLRTAPAQPPRVERALPLLA